MRRSLAALFHRFDGRARAETVSAGEDDRFAAGDTGKDLNGGVRLQPDANGPALGATLPGDPDEGAFRQAVDGFRGHEHGVWDKRQLDCGPRPHTGGQKGVRRAAFRAGADC